MHRMSRACGRLFLLVCLSLAGIAVGNAARAGVHPKPPKPWVPHFSSIDAPIANLRTGPGMRYPIKWVYRRQNMPVLLIRKFGNWRLLRFPDGTQGWMDIVLLAGRRSFVVTAPYAALRRAPRRNGAVIARLRRGVIGWLHPCSASWCRVSTHGYTGFLRRAQIWGTNTNARRLILQRARIVRRRNAVHAASGG